MKLIAILEVDEEKLSSMDSNFEREMGWLEESGITLNKYEEFNSCSDFEYALQKPKILQE